MTLRRWRRIAMGLAAGVIVLCAALLGASFRSDSSNVSVASDSRVATSVPATAEAADDADPGDATDPVRVIEVEDLPDETTANDGAAESADETVTTSDTADDAGPTADDDDDNVDGAAATADDADADAAVATTDASTTETDSGTNNTDAEKSDQPETPTPTPPAPLTADDGDLGTGGGVDDAECALDRLVVYGGARVGGVGASLRDAIVRSGFGAECTDPVSVLASNCPLQFSGVLSADSGYDPQQSFVASSANVDRETLSAVLGELGYSGAKIDILAFTFSEPTPAETWIAIFVPPSFSGWQALADRAGIPATNASLCAASGLLAG